jgi:hypothetical protein
MRTSGFACFAGSIAGIVLFILSGCTSSPAVEKPLWERILDEVPWKNRIVGSIETDNNSLPDDLFRVLYKYGYHYVNSTHKIRLEGGLEMEYSVYEIKREGASYDPDDDTFMFVGEFIPDEANIWLIFSKESDYALYAEPDETNKKEYRFIRVSGTTEY